ncbi:DUF4185 domain-containing protein [Streptomyces sp. NPDC005438]|uniref:DUF4185 domain-containing protein n=1 Tax=Streptomyces sp. NPDC005438 TaxID=3156880 RepID=UPI0033AF270F
MTSTDPTSGGRRRRTARWLAPLLALVVIGVLLVTSRPDGERDRACTPPRPTGWVQDARMTSEFSRYGNDNLRFDDWTGGDGTRSVRLPDGRTLWLSADTFLDRVYEGGRRVPSPKWVRNSVLVMNPSGTLERTLVEGDAQNPRPLFASGFSPEGRELWRWPVQAVVEPRTPGSPDKVVRVLLWQREQGTAPWIFGVPRLSEVATLSLPDLKLQDIRPLHRPSDNTPFDRRVLYGTSAVQQGEWTYVFGADEGSVDGKASRAHVARVPRGQLAASSAWRYWDGKEWQGNPTRSRAILVGRTAQRGATGTYSVVRAKDGWLLLTMDAGAPDGGGMDTLTSYSSCSPTGPWSGPVKVAKPPLPPGGARAGAVPYNPQAHPEFTDDRGRLLVSYDVNVLGSTEGIHRDVNLYRPRFLRLDVR